MKNKNSFFSGSVKVKVSCLCHSEAHHRTLFARNKKLIRFLESFVVLPAITLSMPLGGIIGGVMNTDISNSPQIALAQQQNIGVSNIPPSLSLSGLVFNQNREYDKTQILAAQAKAIDDYFLARNMPLKGMGMKMAEEADKNGLDWRLIPAISIRESTGGKHACKSVPHSYFGWGSCKIGYKSKDEAIVSIARHLSGNNPNTDHHYPKGSSNREILLKYNPPSIIPNYTGEVMDIMDAIGKEEVEIVKSTETVVKI